MRVKTHSKSVLNVVEWFNAVIFFLVIVITKYSLSITKEGRILMEMSLESINVAEYSSKSCVDRIYFSGKPDLGHLILCEQSFNSAIIGLGAYINTRGDMSV